MSESDFDFEIVVIGAGPAGLAAACVAAEYGKAVALVDETPWLGGQIWRGQQSKPSHREAQSWFQRLRRSGAKLFGGTTVIVAPRPGSILAEDATGSHEFRWQKLIIATGARELFLPFPGWTLPGVLGPGGLLALAKNGWPLHDKRIVIAGSGPLLLAAADGLQSHGARIICIVEQTPWFKLLEFGFGLRHFPNKILQATGLLNRLIGTPFHAGAWVIAAEGENQIRSVSLSNGERIWREECDLLVNGFHLIPNVELPLLLGCELEDGFVRVDQWQATTVANVFCAGEPTGIGGAECALIEGEIAGLAAAGQATPAEALFARRSSWHRFRIALASAFPLRPELNALASDDTMVCRCEDVSMGRLRQFKGWREAKLHSRCGMGPCQGRVCGAATKVVFGWKAESIRPPILPARVGSMISHSK